MKFALFNNCIFADGVAVSVKMGKSLVNDLQEKMLKWMVCFTH